MQPFPLFLMKIPRAELGRRFRDNVATAHAIREGDGDVPAGMSEEVLRERAREIERALLALRVSH